MTVPPIQSQDDSRTRKPLILPPDDEHGPGAGYEEGTDPWLEETTGRVLLGYIMLTLLSVALMAAAIALCI